MVCSEDKKDKKKVILNDKDYGSFLVKIKHRIRGAQYTALKAVNKELISLYWDIGRMIVEKQEERGWGRSIVVSLADDLQKEYAGIKGFSSANLWRMRNFYLQYNSSQKLAPLVREISWVKNVIIMEKCRNEQEKEFYIRITQKFGWTKDVLINQVENKSYEKYLLNQTNFDKALPERYKTQAKLAVKDEYTFDFLELGEEHSEKELEKALSEKIRLFLTEIEGHFCFVGSQFRIEIDDEEFFVDLLLYHRKLRSLVAIELKIGDFKPEYVGKMQFYLSALDDKIKLKEENPSIGIIICKNKKRTIVEYTLKDIKKPIGVSTYSLTKTLPKSLIKHFPTKDELSRSLEKL